MEINRQTLDFIAAHASDDVRLLALKGAPEGVDMPFALNQIAGRQTARRKLPSWSGLDGIVYPPRLSMEQCSGESAAAYKASVSRRLLPQGGTLTDLTGGFGVDFSFLSKVFNRAVYVERQEHLCDVMRHNAAVLGLTHATVVCGDGVEYLRSMPPVSLIYIDPARRSATGERTFAISDCTPDVSQLCQLLVSKAEYVMVKLSPMLDWRKAVADMNGRVSEVHIVSEGGECKELLLVLTASCRGVERLCCVNNGVAFTVEAGSSSETASFSPVTRGVGMTKAAVFDVKAAALPPLYLYEPDASVMKAGCFRAIEERFGVCPVSPNSHLFLSQAPVSDFPGRGFVVEKASTMNKKELHHTLEGITQANITVRNFPTSVAELRRKLHLSDGGTTYIFATTLADSTHILLVCQRQHGEVKSEDRRMADAK